MNISSLFRLPDDRLPTEYPWRLTLSFILSSAFIFITFLSFGLSLVLAVISVGMLLNQDINTLWAIAQLVIASLVVVVSAYVAVSSIVLESLSMRSRQCLHNRQELTDRLRKVRSRLAFLRELEHDIPPINEEYLFRENAEIEAEVSSLEIGVKHLSRKAEVLLVDGESFNRKFGFLPSIVPFNVQAIKHFLNDQSPESTLDKLRAEQSASLRFMSQHNRSSSTPTNTESIHQVLY